MTIKNIVTIAASENRELTNNERRIIAEICFGSKVVAGNGNGWFRLENGQSVEVWNHYAFDTETEEGWSY